MVPVNRRIAKKVRSRGPGPHSDYARACDVLGDTWDREVTEYQRRWAKSRLKAAWDRFTGADFLNR